MAKLKTNKIKRNSLQIDWYRHWVSHIAFFICFLFIVLIHAMVIRDILFEGLGRTTYTKLMGIFLLSMGFIAEGLVIYGFLIKPKIPWYIGLSENGIHIKWSKRKIKLVRWSNIERVEVKPPLFNNTFLILRSTGKRQSLGAVSDRFLAKIRKMQEKYGLKE